MTRGTLLVVEQPRRSMVMAELAVTRIQLGQEKHDTTSLLEDLQARNF